MAKAGPVRKDPLSHHHDDEPDAQRVSPWLVLMGLIIAAIVLAALNSEALTAYLEGLEPNVISEAALTLAYIWNGWMESIGLVHVNRAIRDFITLVHDFEFMS